MNPTHTLEESLRLAVFRNFDAWDRVADSFNPLLVVLLLGAALWVSRESQSRAGRFLGRTLLALGLTFLCVKIVKRFDWFEPGDFPSTHMAVATSLATSLTSLNWRWLWLVPLLGFYAWLMTALRFHNWTDIAGALVVAVVLTATIQYLLSRRRQTQNFQASSSGRLSGARRTSTRSSSKSSGNSSSRPRKTTARTR